MTEMETIKRKILLKRQAIEFMQAENRELSHVPAIQNATIEFHALAAVLLRHDAAQPRRQSETTEGSGGGLGGAGAMKTIERIFLKIMRRPLERQIGKEFDPVLSRKLDAVVFLLEDNP